VHGVDQDVQSFVQGDQNRGRQLGQRR
jgi:hypothetical protein